ncbi:helix-turn-helix transcriptional regulator [Streptomyces sodiiphilus]|uniref:Helix-turn-helix transcriptional regulator n=2 Tax=Streptomyces sodiiphilus TaxID=226217 RepID=A0ABN2NZQ1_9ACTN
MHAHEMAAFGVSAEEEIVYRHFLRNPDTAADSLHLTLGLPRERVAHCLDRLQELGLLQPGEEPDRLLPTPPETALARLTELRLREVYQEVQSITQSRHILDNLRAETSTEVFTTRGVEQLEDGARTRSRREELAFFARKEILSVQPSAGFPAEHIDHCRPLWVRSLRRGVKLRKVVSSSALDCRRTADYLGELVSHGALVRVADKVTEHVLVYDRQAALVPLDPWDTSRGSLVAHGSGLVTNLVALFEKIWAETANVSVVLQKPEPSEESALSEIQRRVLTLMCTVGKDETGARGLGVSVRTYRRYIADVMQRLGAASRAQAALLARERGWI